MYEIENIKHSQWKKDFRFLLLAVDLHKHIVFPVTLPNQTDLTIKKLNQPVRGTKVTRKEEFGHSACKTPQNGREGLG